MKKLIWMGCALYLLIGLAHVVLGAVLPQLLAHYGLDYKDGGMLIFLQFFGFFIGVLTTPIWLNWIGRRQAVLMALLGLFAAQVMYSFLPPWHWMLFAAPIAGFGFGIIEAAIGALIIEFVTEKKAVAMSRVEVFFGVGAMVMPMAAGFFIIKGMWELSFPFIAFYTIILALIWNFSNFGEINNLFEKKQLSSEVEVIKPSYAKESLPVLFLLILFFVLYVGIEMSIVNFLPSMMIENNIASQATATISVTVFWSTMIVGRIFAGTIAEKIKYTRYLSYSTGGALIFLILFSISADIWSTYTIILGLGLLMSGIFAIGLIFADSVLPGMTARTTSLLVAAGGVGGAVFPFIIGWSMDAYPLYVSKWILISFTISMVVVIFSAILLSKRISMNVIVKDSL